MIQLRGTADSFEVLQPPSKAINPLLAKLITQGVPIQKITTPTCEAGWVMTEFGCQQPAHGDWYGSQADCPKGSIFTGSGCLPAGGAAPARSSATADQRQSPPPPGAQTMLPIDTPVCAAGFYYDASINGCLPTGSPGTVVTQMQPAVPQPSPKRGWMLFGLLAASVVAGAFIANRKR
jgi:hypothetical protein